MSGLGIRVRVVDAVTVAAQRPCIASETRRSGRTLHLPAAAAGRLAAPPNQDPRAARNSDRIRAAVPCSAPPSALKIANAT